MGAVQELGTSVLLFALVFGMSATVDMEHLKKQINNRNAILTGICLQFVILPFLGFAVVKILGLSPPMGIALLVVTSSPGGSYSNWWCSLFNADLALSVTMTAVSTLISLIMLPVNLIIYTTSTYSGAVVKSLDWRALFVSLVIVIGAISCGLLCSAKVNSHNFNRLANRLGNLAGVALVAFSVVVSSSDKNAELWDRGWEFYLAVAAPCVLGLVLATLITSCFKFELPERVTVSVECCYQNTGIATSVAITMFDGDDLAEAIGVPLFYGIVEAISMGFFCIGAWKFGWTKAPPQENICVVVYTSYEVEEAEMHDPDAIEVVLGLDKDGLPSDLIFQFDESAESYVIDERSLELSEARTVSQADAESSFGNEEERGIREASLFARPSGGDCQHSIINGEDEHASENSAKAGPSSPKGDHRASDEHQPENDGAALPSLFKAHSFDSSSPREGERDEHVRISASLSGDPSAAVSHPEAIASAASFEDAPVSPGRRSRLGLPRRPRRGRRAYHKASTSDEIIDEPPQEEFEEEFDIVKPNKAGATRKSRGVGQYEILSTPIEKEDLTTGATQLEPDREGKEHSPSPAGEHTID